MSTRKPASLDSSLLARKGDASPAIAYDSPLLEELGEPRPAQPATKETEKSAEGSSTVTQGQLGRGWIWLLAHRGLSVLGLLIGIAILFGVALFALKQSPNNDLVPSPGLSQSKPVEAISSAMAAPTPPDPSLSESQASDPTEKTETAMPAVAVAAAPQQTQTSDVSPAETATAVAVVPAVPVPATAKPAGRAGRYLLQLASVFSEQSARRELARLEKRLGGLLGHRKIIVVKASPRGKAPVYRLRASSYESRAAAREACKRIQTKKMACLVIRR